MATGTTANHVSKRNQIVKDALTKLRVIKAGQMPDYNVLRDGIVALNDILREEDNDQTGIKRSLWALSTAHLFLRVDNYVYGINDGLASNILDLQSIKYRDTSGSEGDVDIISPTQYERLTPKNETGEVKCVYLKENIDRSLQTLHIWPAPTSVGTTEEVLGTDGKNYKCVLKHTSSEETRPITGPSYKLFWQAGGSGDAWADDTEYTNGVLLRYLYKRPLFDFDDPEDDPDLPLGWGTYLKWRLCIDLSPNHSIPLEERAWFQQQVDKAKDMLFPTMRAESTDVHNKALYY